VSAGTVSMLVTILIDPGFLNDEMILAPILITSDRLSWLGKEEVTYI
jgi:hypothetical protein